MCQYLVRSAPPSSMEMGRCSKGPWQHHRMRRQAWSWRASVDDSNLSKAVLSHPSSVFNIVSLRKQVIESVHTVLDLANILLFLSLLIPGTSFRWTVVSLQRSCPSFVFYCMGNPAASMCLIGFEKHWGGPRILKWNPAYMKKGIHIRIPKGY